MFGDLIKEPQKFIRDKGDRERFRTAITNIVGDVVEGLNAEVQDVGEDFDYRDKLRDEKWVNNLSKNVVRDHMILIRRNKIQSFKDEWEG